MPGIFKNLSSKALALASLICIPSVCLPQYPEREITVVVPVAAGSATYRLAQQATITLASVLSQPVKVESAVSPTGRAAIERLLRAPSDGYTLLLADSRRIALMPSLHRSFKFDPTVDLAPVSRLYNVPLIVVARKDFDAADVAGLRAAKQVRIQAGALLSDSYACALTLKQGLGANAAVQTQVSSGPALADVLAGRADVFCDTNPTLRPYVVNNSVRQIPVEDAGVGSASSFTSWTAVFVRSGTPEPVVAALTAAMQGVKKDPGFQAGVASLGGAASSESDGEANTLMEALKAERASMTGLIDAAGKYVD
jgi:tripartite-type tricarboxylate transporter receptor subunit TctC